MAGEWLGTVVATIRRGAAARRILTALLVVTGLVGLADGPMSATPAAAALTKPTMSVAPAMTGDFQVGASATVTPGTWAGTAPITFRYLFQTCNADGTGCATAPGLFANGARPALLLVAATAGKALRVRVTAVNPVGSLAFTTPLSPVVSGYPAAAPPKVEIVNGVPDQVSWSTSSTFQFQATGSGLTLTCSLDATAAACPDTAKVTYAKLATGTHTFTVTAANAYGTAQASYTWNVEAPPAPTGCPGCYQPALGATWQWQLTLDKRATAIDTTVTADMYEIDGFANDAATVARLHSLPGTNVPARGVTCYLSAGTREDWRPDAPAYDPMLLGNAYIGYPDERWVDIRRISALAPILRARMDMCRAKGFDAIEFDNVAAWAAGNKTGLNITQADATAFVIWLAGEAHARGMSMALKSAVELVPAVRTYVDFSVVEECFRYGECTRSSVNTGGTYGYDMMTELGKAVFEAEYTTYDPANNVCAQANALRFGTIYKQVALGSYRVSCNG